MGIRSCSCGGETLSHASDPFQFGKTKTFENTANSWFADLANLHKTAKSDLDVKDYRRVYASFLEIEDVWQRNLDENLDPTAQGTTWYERWVGELREKYYTLFGVEQQVLDAEARYAGMTPGPGGEPLWQSDLYGPPQASVSQASSPVSMLSDGEQYLC